MARPEAAAAPRARRLPFRLGAFVARPRLTGSLLLGVALGAACAWAGLRTSTSAILGWDAACLGFFAATLPELRRRDAEHIRARARKQDEGRGLILGLVLLATAAGLFAIGFELSLARGMDGLEKAARVALAFGTAALSWFMVQLVFALHYAHEYYAPDRAAGGEATAQGLAFPGGEDPDYWDFLHFSVVIGVACQTADIAFTRKPLRRIGTLHGVVAFTFNTIVVALTINLVAALF